DPAARTGEHFVRAVAAAAELVDVCDRVLSRGGQVLLAERRREAAILVEDSDCVAWRAVHSSCSETIRRCYPVCPRCTRARVEACPHARVAKSVACREAGRGV